MKFRLAPKNEPGGENINEQEENVEATEDIIPISIKSIEIQNEGAIGIEFCSSIDNCVLAVKNLDPEGLAKAADNSSSLVGGILVSINNKNIIEGKGPWIQKTFECLQRFISSSSFRIHRALFGKGRN